MNEIDYNPDKHNRRSIRLKGYNYLKPGYYYVTICTMNRECLFGWIINEKMILNDAGRMIQSWFSEIGNKFDNVNVDSFIVMPNHFHGIIEIIDIHVGADRCVCPEGEHTGSPLPRVIQWFKTMTTNEYIRNVKAMNWPPFPQKLWQRNYFDRIVRNETELNRIREYIMNNPIKWNEDRENPIFNG